jgi:hypothetical protein
MELNSAYGATLVPIQAAGMGRHRGHRGVFGESWKLITMEENPYKSPTTEGGHGIGLPRIPSWFCIETGILMLVVGVPLDIISYASPTVAMTAYSIGAALNVFGTVLLLIPLARWIRGR